MGGSLWVLPSFIWLALCLLLPLLTIVLFSLGRREAYGGVEFGLNASNYLHSLNALYLKIYLRSFVLAAVTTLLCLILAFPIAYFIASQRRVATRHLLLFLVTLPFWTSFLVRTYAWILILRTEGLVNHVLVGSGITRVPLNLLYNEFAILVGLVSTELPFMILPLFTVLDRMDRTLLEASADLGCSGLQTLLRVLLPLCRPGIWAGVMLVFVPSLGAFITPDLLGGAKTMMMGNLIQSQFAVVRDQPFGSAVSLLLTAVVLIPLGISYRAAKLGAEVRML